MSPFIAGATLALLAALPALAQQQLTFADALDRARQSGPAVIAARLRIEETRARLAGASLRFATNPTVDAGAGLRGGEVSTTDYGIGVGQDIEFPQRRRARVDAARAGVTQEEQRARETERATLREVAIVFLRAVESRERGEAAAGGMRLAEDALRIAERRYAAGDVAQLDVNLARTAVARADAEARIAAAVRSGLETQLQVLLGISEPVTVGGSLRDALAPAATDSAARADAAVRAAERPDIRLLDAGIAEAEADQRLARTLRWPGFGLRASYAKEGHDRVALGGVGFSLPLFQRGQEATAVATARLTRLHAEREALARTIDAEVRGASATFHALSAAAAEYERTVLPLVEQNERLALESYQVGQIGLGDLLLVRREALDARRAFIDQLIETRLAEVELRSRTGEWQ